MEIEFSAKSKKDLKVAKKRGCNKLDNCIVDIEARYTNEHDVPDPDNFDTRTLLNLLKSYFIVDDSLLNISLIITAKQAETTETIVKLVPTNNGNT